MKQTLSVEQSATLIAKGISADKASERTLDFCDIITPLERRELLPIFTLADVCSLLPKGVIHNGLSCKLRITSWYDEHYYNAAKERIITHQQKLKLFKSWR